MNRQDTASGESTSGLMARWLASGGALEVPAGIDAAADDGLQAGGWSGHPVFCADDGLQAGRMTTHPFACADEGLRCSNITRGYGCIPPQADDGPTAGDASFTGCGI